MMFKIKTDICLLLGQRTYIGLTYFILILYVIANQDTNVDHIKL